MRTGILTFHNAVNYGALLQTYALQTQLEYLGCTVQVINYSNKYVSSTIKNPDIRSYHNPLNYVQDKKFYDNFVVRKKKMQEFTAKYIKLTAETEQAKLPELGESFDLFFVGSDQVWNDKITRNDDTYYLNFVPPYKKCSYAASIGSKEIPMNRVSHVYSYLKDFRAISVREITAKKSLAHQMGIESERVLDPTLLLSKKDYGKFFQSEIPNERYILVYMLLFSESLLQSAKIIAKKYGLSVVCVNASGKNVKFGKDRSKAGIEEWLTLLNNAEYVFTNSFHGVAFSINFNKNFYVELPPARVNANSRIIDILDILKLQNRIIQNGKFEESEINYNNVNRLLQMEREKSIKYIENVLETKTMNKNKDISRSIIQMAEEHCCGCGLCQNVCPVEAIDMKTDEKGFLYPVINAEKCINCGKCLRNCAYKKYEDCSHDKMPISIAAAYSKMESVVKKSSSGGIFFELAQYILSQGGIVYGAAFSNDFSLRHIGIDSIKNIDPLLGSKYVQSNILNVYKEIKDKLQKGKHVMFVGTPCQCSAVKSYCEGYNEKLYVVDFVCHGVPSQLLLKDHIKYVEKKFGKKVVRYTPRSKIAGWGHHELFEFSDGTSDYTHPLTQAYKHMFHSDLPIRNSCYNCPFTNFDRPGDITMADYWGLKESEPNLCHAEGTSMILINTNKGAALLKKIETVCINETSISTINKDKQPHLYRPLFKKEAQIQQFWLEYQKFGYEFLANKYANCNKKALLKRRIKNNIIYKKIRGYK